MALNQLWVDGWAEAMQVPRWNGLRVVAADGVCMRLPKWGENVDAYGVGPCKDGSVVMTRCVSLFSTACRQFLEITVGRYDEGERALLLRALGALKADDVLVLDRGYPAWWLFAALTAKGIRFCARIERCNWPLVQQLMNSSQDELVVQQCLNAQTRKALRELGLPEMQSLGLRLVKVRLPNGTIEVLATALLDIQRYPASSFGPLYGKRWAIEEAFKTLKHRLHLEGFAGELPLSIEQEIQAKALMYNIGRALCVEAQSQLPPDKSERWQVNHAYALKHLGRLMVAWFRGESEELARVTQSLVKTLSQTLELIRPGRSFKRKHAIGGAQRPRRAYR